VGQVVRRHGGSIDVDRELGAVFTVILPLSSSGDQTVDAP